MVHKIDWPNPIVHPHISSPIGPLSVSPLQTSLKEITQSSLRWHAKIRLPEGKPESNAEKNNEENQTTPKDERSLGYVKTHGSVAIHKVCVVVAVLIEQQSEWKANTDILQRTEYEEHFTGHRNSSVQGLDWVLNRFGRVTSKLYSDTVTNYIIKMSSIIISVPP